MCSRVKITDFILVSNYTNGDENSLGILVKRHQSYLVQYIGYCVRDNDVANDIFQDTFIIFIDAVKTGKYKNNGRFKSYIQTIAHNLAMNYLRKQKKIPRNSGTDDWNIFDNLKSEYHVNAEPTAEHKLIKKDSLNMLRFVFEKLPKRHQEIIHLRLKEQKTFKEIATEKEIPLNTCLGQYRHAITCLKKIINKHQLIGELTTI